MRPKGTAQQLEGRRRRAIQLLEQGKSPSAVARALSASQSSVWRWKEAYEAQGWDGLRARPIPGRPPGLSASEKRKLLKTLERGPSAAGYRTELWTLKRVGEVIERDFGVRYDISNVWRILRGLGWSCQKPQRKARERDEEAIRQWRTQRWPYIKKRSSEGLEHRFPG